MNYGIKKADGRLWKVVLNDNSITALPKECFPVDVTIEPGMEQARDAKGKPLWDVKEGLVIPVVQPTLIPEPQKTLTVSKVGMLLAMSERGFYDPNDLTTGLLAAIANMPDPAQKAATQIYFQFETVVKRFHPVVLGLQQSLELDDAAVDALFAAAKAKDNEP